MIPHPNTRRNTIRHDCDCRACLAQRARRDRTDVIITDLVIAWLFIMLVIVPLLRWMGVTLP